MFWSRPPAFGVVSAPHDGGVPVQARVATLAPMSMAAIGRAYSSGL